MLYFGSQATPTPEPEGGATVVFRDLPEAITYGANDAEVRAMAAEMLELAVAEDMGRGEEIPAASAAQPLRREEDLGKSIRTALQRIPKKCPYPNLFQLNQWIG